MARLSDDNRLSLRRRDVAADWDYAKNAPLNPDQFTVSSNEWVWWVCRAGLGHPSFQRTVEQRTRNNPLKCPDCPRRSPGPRRRDNAAPLPTAHLNETNRLSTCRPDVAEAWDYVKNAPHTPDQVSIKSSSREWSWKCMAGLGHDPYPATVLKQTRSSAPPRCPDCPRRQMLGAKVTDDNRFSLHAPKELLESWNKTENLPLTPELVAVGSGKVIVWDCLASEGKHPSWPISVAARMGNANREGTGCRYCALVRTSRAELRLKAELGLFFTVSSEPNRIPMVGGPPEEVDVADHSAKLVVEFDGAYFHSRPGSLERDTAKNARLAAAGWTVVRVREHDLHKINPRLDVTVAKDAHPYIVASAVIRHLSNLGLIQARRAEDYYRNGRLQAEELSNEWIIKRLGSLMSKAELDSYDSKWKRMHEALVSFEGRFGRCRVPDGILVKGIDLRTWCYTQRSLQRQGKLSEERQQQLKAIPTWTFDPWIESFRDGLEQYQLVFSEQGSGHRPSFADVRAVRRWAQKLREHRRKQLEKGLDLPPYQLEAMNQVQGWLWTPRDARFAEQIDVLLDYCSRLNTDLGSIKDKDLWQEERIGSWITNWRSRRRLGRLTEHQIRELESLPGWTWSKNDDAWDAQLAALAAYGDTHGDLKVSLNAADAEQRQLAKWKHKYMSNLRGQSGDRADRLRELLTRFGEDWR